MEHMAEAPSRLSPSGAAAFDGCARRWKFKYVDKLPEPPGEAAVVGTFAHLVLEHLCQLPGAERTQEAAKLLARSLWPSVAENPEFVGLDLSEDDARRFRWKAWTAIVGLWSIEDPTMVDVVETEQKLTATIGGVPFVGVVDRVDREGDSYVVTDFKSGTVPKPRFQDDKIQQIMLYSAALAKQGREPAKARLHYLGQQSIEVTVTPRRLEDAAAKLRSTWDSIQAACETDEFAASPGVLCGWCPFRDQCPEGTAHLDERRLAGTLPSHAPAAVA